MYKLRILDSPEEFTAVEDLQRQIWSGNETDIVPGHLLLASTHNGGLVIGAYQVADENNEEGLVSDGDELMDREGVSSEALMVGFVFGFPGFYNTPDGPRLKHHSHMLGVLADARDRGLGFALKRAQWQMVRHQGIDLVTWTFDPLLSRNAHLNIARLGAVCNTYLRDVYGVMRDHLNAGLASDRFQVEWWVNTNRVRKRISKNPKPPLDLAHYLAAGVKIINPSRLNEAGHPLPMALTSANDLKVETIGKRDPILLLEIPADFQTLRSMDISLADEWRKHTRLAFEHLFQVGYIVTDFVHLSGNSPRSFYVLVHGESTL